MRVLVYQSYNFTPHLEASLEIAMNYRDLGYEVFFLICDKSFDTCFGNPKNLKSGCYECFWKLNAGLDIIKVPTSHRIYLSKPKDYFNSLVETTFDDQNDLRNLEYKGFDIGMSTVSSIISKVRNHNFDLTEHSEYIRRSIETSTFLIDSLPQYSKKVKPDEVILFNGRFIETRPVLRYCQMNNIDYSIHERAGKLEKYWMVSNDIPHSISYVKEEINTLWNNSNHERNIIGAKFFKDRRNNVEKAWYSFTKDQIKGFIPPIDKNKKKCRYI